MKSILKYIPGFRSQVKWEILVARIYYLLALLMKARKNNKPIKAIVLVLVLSLGTMVGCAKQDLHKLKVHYLDVGQGDSILIQLPNGQTALIDGGTRSNGYIVSDYLSQLKIATIDYLVATHPHEDHIGGLIEVINKYHIGKVYMPKIGHTTQAFEDLLLAIRSKDKKITSAKAGDMILDKEGLSLEVIAPGENESDSNLNNHSLVVKLNYRENSFLFTGDAEKESEGKMVDAGYNLKSDVLKVGHHGSNTSTTDSFLNGVGLDMQLLAVVKIIHMGTPMMTP